MKKYNWDELIQEYLDKFVCEEDKSAVALIYNRAYMLEKFNAGNHELSIEMSYKNKWQGASGKKCCHAGRRKQYITICDDLCKRYY